VGAGNKIRDYARLLAGENDACATRQLHLVQSFALDRNHPGILDNHNTWRYAQPSALPRTTTAHELSVVLGSTRELPDEHLGGGI
jgi:hypothetical protein